jgi:hypothetical protein
MQIEEENGKIKSNAITPMKKPHPSGRRRYYYSPRSGSMHASGSIAAVAASLYFKLAGGTAEQRERAEEWRVLFNSIGEGLTP